jgi:hypothetical protein
MISCCCLGRGHEQKYREGVASEVILKSRPVHKAQCALGRDCVLVDGMVLVREVIADHPLACSPASTVTIFRAALGPLQSHRITTAAPEVVRNIVGGGRAP